jgi:hypothetical protein
MDVHILKKKEIFQTFINQIHHDEPSVSLKCWDVLEYLHNWQFLEKGSAP